MVVHFANRKYVLFQSFNYKSNVAFANDKCYEKSCFWIICKYSKESLGRHDFTNIIDPQTSKITSKTSQKCFSENFKTFSVFTKYLFSNLCSETGLFETNNVKIYK